MPKNNRNVCFFFSREIKRSGERTYQRYQRYTFLLMVMAMYSPSQCGYERRLVVDIKMEGANLIENSLFKTGGA